MHSTWFEGALTQTVGKSLVRMCSDSRWACVPSCLQACLTTGWTCHRDQPLQNQTQNRDTIDSSSSPYMLVSSRTAPHALTKSLRNKCSKNKTHGDSQRTFVPDCLWSGGLFSSFSVYFLVSFLGLGLLSDNLVSSPEFDRDLDLHFNTLLDHFSAFLPMLFSNIFRCFPRPLFFSTFIENECVWGANG